jgi:hypothetical protein
LASIRSTAISRMAEQYWVSVMRHCAACLGLRQETSCART